MTNEDFDKWINGKLEEESFDYRPADWQEALKLIEKEEKKERPIWFWWSSGLAAVVVVGLAIWLTGPTNNVESQSAIKQENSIINNSIEANDDEALANISDSEVTSSINTQVQSEYENQNKLVRKEVIPKITSRRTALLNLPDPMVDENPIQKPISSPVSESVAESRSGEDFLSSEIIPSEEIDQPNTPETTTNAPSKPFSFAWASYLDPLKPSDLETSYDWERKTITAITPVRKLMPFNLGLEFGIKAFANPYINTGTEDLRTITGFSAGATTRYRFSKRLALNADVLYEYRTGTFDNSAVIETNQYSFDRLDQVTRLLPRSLHSINVPIYGTLHFNRHRISAGASLNWLMGVYGDIETGRYQGGNVLDESKQTGWIESDGFNVSNTGLLLGYDYHLTEQWLVSFRSNYLLSPIINESAASSLENDILKENSRANIQLGFTYYLK